MSEQTAYQVLPLTEIKPSKTNPRKNFDPAKLEQLAESIRQHGIVEPLIVRPMNGHYELVAGERRLRAAKLAELETVPVLVKPIDDVAALEIQTIENLQRDDLHPLEEAAGYLALQRTAKYDVARIADKIGRSAKYVYDRLKLLALVPEAQRLFLAGKFEAGHAILLARLKPEDQKRAIAVADDTYGAARADGLFQHDRGLPFDEAFEKAVEKDPYLGVKAVSVREFERWIEHSVKASPADVDPFLFPEAAATLDGALEQDEKVILITRDYRPSDAVKGSAGKQRIHGERTWLRADGQEKSKTCDRSVMGFVACGPGQGEAFRVCVNKEKCEVHYGKEIRARAKHRKAVESGDKTEADRYRQKQERAEADRKKREAEEQAKQARYQTALPALLTALAVKIAALPAGAKGPLGAYLIDQGDDYGGDFKAPATEKLLPAGTSAEDLVRHCVFAHLRKQSLLWGAHENFPKVLKAFGLDYGKLLNAAAPVEKPKVQTAAKAGKPTSGTCRKCGCTEEKACAGCCGWVDKAETKCSSCFPVPDKKARPKKAAKKKGKGKK